MLFTTLGSKSNSNALEQTQRRPPQKKTPFRPPPPNANSSGTASAGVVLGRDLLQNSEPIWLPHWPTQSVMISFIALWRAPSCFVPRRRFRCAPAAT